MEKMNQTKRAFEEQEIEMKEKEIRKKSRKRSQRNEIDADEQFSADWFF